MANPVPLIISVPTSAGGATPAATFLFFSSNYRMPRQGRSTAQDVVHNQNGVFKYRYDNGPNSYAWEPFSIIISDRFLGYLGPASQQMANLEFLWNYVEGPMGFAAPGRVYRVDWADAPLEPQLRAYPGVGDKLEYVVVVNLEEA